MFNAVIFLAGSLGYFLDGDFDFPSGASSGFSYMVFISSISQRPSKMSVRSLSPNLFLRNIWEVKLLGQTYWSFSVCMK